MNDDILPIYDLVKGRLEQLGISKGELILRCGYKNVAKGLRRLDAIWGGDLDSSTSRAILEALPTALEIDERVIQTAINESAARLEISRREKAALQDAIVAAQDAEWRVSFVPDAYLLGTETRPSQITIYGLTGGAQRWLRIPLNLSRPPVTFAGQALSLVRRTIMTPFFGKTTGFVVNYAPDRAIRFDIDGNPVAQLPGAYYPGEVSLNVGSRTINAGDFGKMMGFVDF
jgi:hypothetical protein